MSKRLIVASIIILAGACGIVSPTYAAVSKKFSAPQPIQKYSSAPLSGQSSGNNIPFCVVNGILDPNSHKITQSDIDTSLSQNHPYTISRPGYYCLGSDITVNFYHPGPNANGFYYSSPSSSIILIETGETKGGTVLDFGSFTLQNTYTSTVVNNDISTAVHIRQSGNIVSVKRGAIRGFNYGIVAGVPASSNAALSIQHMTLEGIASRAVQISQYQRVLIEHNTFLRVAFGIDISSVSNADIQQNTFRGFSLFNSGAYYIPYPINGIVPAIGIGRSDHVRIHNNTIVMDELLYGRPWGPDILGGVVAQYSEDVIISENNISGAHYGTGIAIYRGRNNRIESNTIQNAAKECSVAQDGYGIGVLAIDEQALVVEKNIFQGPFSNSMKFMYDRGPMEAIVRNNTFYRSSYLYSVFSSPSAQITMTDNQDVEYGCF